MREVFLGLSGANSLANPKVAAEAYGILFNRRRQEAFHGSSEIHETLRACEINSRADGGKAMAKEA